MLKFDMSKYENVIRHRSTFSLKMLQNEGPLTGIDTSL